MKEKKWLFYLAYAVVLFGYSLIGVRIIIALGENTSNTFNPYPEMCISAIIYFILGVILGVPMLVSELKKEGKWKVNLPRLILIGIPSLALSIKPLMFFLTFPFYLVTNPMIFQIIFGFILITSFYKEKNPL